MERKHTFDAVAELYDEMRPGYPDALVERVLERARLDGDARILEVGCGPGKATTPYAQRGYRLLCLEPGPNLASIARRNLAEYPRVEMVEEEFESWTVEPSAFDLVVSATAWHHVDPNVRYERAAKALKPQGTLAIYANWTVDHFREGQAAYDRHVPAWTGRPSRTIEQGLARARASLQGSGWFTDIEVHRYPWTRRLTADEYVRLLQTHSDHCMLGPDRLGALLDDLRTCIEGLGGAVDRDYESVLLLATPQDREKSHGPDHSHP
ncbi:MAG: class I SAM-dependent methyltransferase [Planctomycetota bacterium]|jgi:SAM-dependent methyltransferase